MLTLSTKLIVYLFKKYNVKDADAILIIEEERHNHSTIENITENLINLYVVA